MAFGPRAGQQLLKVQGAVPLEPSFEQELCADTGFCLRTVVRCEADDRQVLERLCRYATRPALACDRVPCAGRVVLERDTPWRDGAARLVMSSSELMQRLAALVRRPRLHLIRFHGVLSPSARLHAA